MKDNKSSLDSGTRSEVNNLDNSKSIGSYTSAEGSNQNVEISYSIASQHFESELTEYMSLFSGSHSSSRAGDLSENIYTSKYGMVAPKVEISDNPFINLTGEHQNMPIDILKSSNEYPSQEYVHISINTNTNDFVMWRESYDNDLKNEYEFEKLKSSSLNPSIREYKAIQSKISSDNIQKFLEFLQICEIQHEVYDKKLTLRRTRKVLILLDDNFFMKGPSPRIETHSLIEKLKISINYHLSRKRSADEISQWIIIFEEIRIKWKNIDMVSLIKRLCNLYMIAKKENNIESDEMLIILNRFIGCQKKYQERLANEAYKWLLDNYKEKDLRSKAKSMLDSLVKNGYKFPKEKQKDLKKIQNELNHWTFDAKRKTKKYERNINNYTETGQSSKLKIINIQQIKNKTKYSDEVELYECVYGNDKALIQEYKFNKNNLEDKKRIFKKVAKLIYLSRKKRNEGGIFINYLGLYLEKIDEINGSEECYHLNVVMEWCSSTLSSYIELFNEETLSSSIDTILNGFLLLHKYGMAQSDIGPENILAQEINGKIFLKLADYDISSAISSTCAAFSRDSSSSSFGGKPQFAAPEIRYLLDNKVAKAKFNRMKADVYSLALVFIYLRFNESPPQGRLDRDDFIKWHIQEIKIPWFKALLENMLSEDPRKRKKIGDLIKLKKKLQSTR